MIFLPAALGAAARGALAIALTLSWLVMAGTPASAAVTGAAVESPSAGAALKKATPLVVVVDRTRTGREQITVKTRLLYGVSPAAPDPQQTEQPGLGQQEPAPNPGEPVSKKVLELPQQGREDTGPTTERRRFAGLIDPYNLAWLPQPGVARNGGYILEYKAVSDQFREPEEWQRFEFRIDAPPPAPSSPAAGVADAAAKRLTVRWLAASVPDLSHFTVERKQAGGQWKVAQDNVDPKTTQITDTVAKYGTYTYRVTAVRPAGDGSGGVRTARSPASEPVDLRKPSEPAPREPSGSDGSATSGDGSGTSSGGAQTTQVPSLSSGTGSNPNPSLRSESESSGAPGVSMPRGFDDTYRGPLDYGVEQKEVTERVPVDIARGGAGSDSTLQVLDRAIDQERVLPPVAGGLILVISAAHVLRYLNE